MPDVVNIMNATYTLVRERVFFIQAPTLSPTEQVEFKCTNNYKIKINIFGNCSPNYLLDRGKYLGIYLNLFTITKII